MSMILSAIMAEAVSVTLKTHSEGSYNTGGDWVEGAETSQSIKADVQPVSGSQLKDLPESIRSDVEMCVRTNHALADNDVLVYEDVEYRIMHTKRWVRDGYTKAMIGKVSA